MNAGAGSIGSAKCDERKAEVLAALTAAGIDAEVHLCEPAQLTRTARDLAASGVDAVVAAGGDGTVSAVASALAGGNVPLAVLPLGTLNHFAKDLRMPLELGEAALAIASGNVTRIDVGELNGRIFVNNSSIGLYPETVIRRDRDRKASGRGKWTAMFLAAFRVLRRFPLLKVRIVTESGTLRARTPLVFIGNNAYTINVLELGERAHLDRGQLSLYMIKATSRLKMFWVTVRAILQRLDAVADFEAHAIREALIRTGHRRLQVAIDGEVELMTPPLYYRSRPGALAVIAPRTLEVSEPAPTPVPARGDAA
ncbi:MAG: NAD(+)/NADH kinase [Deltaproteobacteria bacterium]|nr:NAD(+)/NADH kinase [Deltaproteobacteria bacterium]